jgi:hypothetical protein
MRQRGIGDPALIQYAVPGQREPRYSFIGGTFPEPLPEAEVATAAPDRLAAEFSATAHRFDGQLRTYDAGELGGEVRCTTLVARATDRRFAACGWVDRWTIGSVIDASRTGTEADLVATLLAMREDLEVKAS